MRYASAYDQETPDFLAPAPLTEDVACQLLIVGGGLSGLSAAEAAACHGLDVVIIDKAAFGKGGASGLNAGQFLTGWAKPVPTMVAELGRQEQGKGRALEEARWQGERRVRAFLRRTVEGCERLEQLDHHYNLRASVRRGAVLAARSEAEMADLAASYMFMQRSNFRALMPRVAGRRPPFFELLSASQLQDRAGTSPGFYVGGVVDHLGGSFRPRQLVNGLARALSRRGVRLYAGTEAEALDVDGGELAVRTNSGVTIRTRRVFMANAYARAINGDVQERAIFLYDYVIVVEVPQGARLLTRERVLSDTRDPCFYARRHRDTLYMGYEETAETSPRTTRAMAIRTLNEAKRVFSGLSALRKGDIRSAWAGPVYFTRDEYPFTERRHGGALITFAAPSDHGNALAARVGQLVGDLVGLALAPGAGDTPRLRRAEQQMRLFEGFPKGARLPPGRRYREAAASSSG
jgi:gamma-glutamylputrescine oxidase